MQFKKNETAKVWYIFFFVFALYLMLSTCKMLPRLCTQYAENFEICSTHLFVASIPAKMITHRIPIPELITIIKYWKLVDSEINKN